MSISEKDSRLSMYELAVKEYKGHYFAPVSRLGGVDIDEAVFVFGGSSLNRLGNLPTIGPKGEKEYQGRTLLAQVRRLGDVKPNRRFGYLCVSDLTKYVQVAQGEIDARFPQERENRMTKS